MRFKSKTDSKGKTELRFSPILTRAARRRKESDSQTATQETSEKSEEFHRLDDKPIKSLTPPESVTDFGEEKQAIAKGGAKPSKEAFPILGLHNQASHTRQREGESVLDYAQRVQNEVLNTSQIQNSD